MIRLDIIKQTMDARYKEDEARFFVEASGDTLDEALNSAAIQLGVKVNFVDYEVMQKGSSGFFALFPREWKIIAYKNKKADIVEKEGVEASHEDSTIIEALKEESVDGQAFICCFSTGIFLKVTQAQGKGQSVKINTVIEKFKKRKLDVPHESVLMPIIKKADGEYKRVASYEHEPVNDALMTVSLAEGDMAAYIRVRPPGPGGADISVEQIEYFLSNNHVVFGFDKEKAQAFQDMPIYNTDYLVASGKKPKNGADAHMKYYFETNPDNLKLQEGQGGQIDFRDLNLIQNVVEGQALAEKIPAERGVPGMTVSGHYLPAKNGEDRDIPLGANTHLADDGLTVLADINGHVRIAKGRITVEPVFVVEGDVSFKTGHIEFLGSVMVMGNVDDGFSVRASGNIEVKGSVGKSILEAEGDIIIGQGVVGKDEGKIRCGKSLWAKFIQNEKLIIAGENVIVTNGIIKSSVMAKKKIICNGNRPDIMGGVLSATEAIIARNIGSATAGNDTILNVGFDPQTKARHTKLKQVLEKNEKMLLEVNRNLKVLEEQKKRPGAKVDEEVLEKNKTSKYTLEAEIENMKAEIAKLQQCLDMIKTEGRVSAYGRVYEGVTINIKDVSEIVKRDCSATTFHLENGMIKYVKYKKEDIMGGPSGYTAN